MIHYKDPILKPTSISWFMSPSRMLLYFFTLLVKPSDATWGFVMETELDWSKTHVTLMQFHIYRDMKKSCHPWRDVALEGTQFLPETNSSPLTINCWFRWNVPVSFGKGILHWYIVAGLSEKQRAVDDIGLEKRNNHVARE